MVARVGVDLDDAVQRRARSDRPPRSARDTCRRAIATSPGRTACAAAARRSSLLRDRTGGGLRDEDATADRGREPCTTAERRAKGRCTHAQMIRHAASRRLARRSVAPRAAARRSRDEAPRSASAGLAPLSRASSLPPAKTASVGIERMPKRWPRSDSSSVFTLTTRAWPAWRGRDLLQLGRDHAARAAPRRPVVHHDRQRRCATDGRTRPRCESRSGRPAR